MRVLVCGATGFIGTAICQGLRAAGHDVVRAVRCPSEPRDIAVDFSVDTDRDTWLPRLEGIDAVVNAVGIIVERGAVRFQTLHARAPIALFEACAAANVQRVVQISALGAATGDTEYFRTKRAADEALMRLPLEWQILRPALVYGEHGDSASAFRTLATLPVITLPSLPDTARFQPVHVEDVVAAVVLSLAPSTPIRQCVDLTGATAHTLREMITGYRQAFDLAPAVWLTIPGPVMAVTARIAGLVPGVPLNAETWRMLQQGSAADAGPASRLLGRKTLGLSDFIVGSDAERLRSRAASTWQLLLLRAALAAVWIVTALLGAFVYPLADSLDLLAEVGLRGDTGRLALYGACLLDLFLGVATLVYPRRITWLAQVAVVVVYTVLIAVAMPAWLMHPFGPVLKNLPILAILTVLIAQERRWTTSR